MAGLFVEWQTTQWLYEGHPGAMKSALEPVAKLAFVDLPAEAVGPHWQGLK